MANIEEVIRIRDEFSGTLNKLNKMLDQTDKQAKKTADSLSNKLDKSLSGFGLVKFNAAISSATVAVNTLRQAWDFSIQRALNFSQAEAGIRAMSGSIQNEMVTALEEASKTSLFAKQQIFDVGKALTPMIKNSGNATQNMTDLMKIAEKLALTNPAQGMEGAAFSLREAITGDFMSIVERFNLSRAMIKDAGLKKFTDAQDVDGFIKALDEVLMRMGITQNFIDTMRQSVAGQFTLMGKNWQDMWLKFGQSVEPALVPLLDALNNLFASTQFQEFMAGLAENTASLIGNLTVAVGWLKNMLGVINALSPLIAGVAAGMMTFAAASKAMAIYTAIATVFTGGLSAAFATLTAILWANPLVWIAAAIIGVAVAISFLLKKLGILKKTTDTLAKPTMPVTNNFQIDEIKKVGSVGKIDSDVSIADEDIKLMRDLAERQFVQNLVAVSPNFNFKNAFNGKATDQNVLGTITKQMEEAFTNSASGVYN